MKKIVLVFGLLSAALSAVMMCATVPFMHQIGYDRGLIVGYTAIVISLLFVYFGVRSYRDNVGAGRITFGRAFSVGILITLISCVGYVIAWEILYFNFLPGFMDNWTAHVVETLRASGASDAVLAAKAAEMADMKRMMDSPILGPLMVFIEPFPVGLVVTLISAAVLKRK
jgi:hypothetical protein